jgi:hypothetical protein
VNTISDTYTPAPASAPASYVPDQDDLDEMHLVRAAHDLLDLAHDMPLETRLAVLDYVSARLDGRPATSPREAAHV